MVEPLAEMNPDELDIIPQPGLGRAFSHEAIIVACQKAGDQSWKTTGNGYLVVETYFHGEYNGGAQPDAKITTTWNTRGQICQVHIDKYSSDRIPRQMSYEYDFSGRLISELIIDNFGLPNQSVNMYKTFTYFKDGSYTSKIHNLLT